MDEGRKCGEAEVVFLSRLENVMSFGFMSLRRFLNVGLSRLDFSSPFGRGAIPPPLPYGRLELVAGECFVSFASVSNPGSNSNWPQRHRAHRDEESTPHPTVIRTTSE